MRPLVVVRRATPFDPDFIRRSPLLWPLEAAARRLPHRAAFPTAADLNRVFPGDPPVRFEPAEPRPRRRQTVDPASLYDGRIALERRVPTREGCWHDLMNALVWGTFPASKSALHARQHGAIAARITPGARALPPTRTRELDALALIDEGGVIVSAGDPDAVRAGLRARPSALRDMLSLGEAEAIIFGHAIFESLVLGVSPAAVAAIVVRRDASDDGREGRLQRVDAALSAALRDPASCRAPNELCRVDVSLALAPPA